MVTLELIDKTVCSIKKSCEISIENKEFEQVVNSTFDVLVEFRDQMVKRQTMLNQEQWAKKPIINLITDTMSNSVVSTNLLLF